MGLPEPIFHPQVADSIQQGVLIGVHSRAVVYGDCHDFSGQPSVQDSVFEVKHGHFDAVIIDQPSQKLNIFNPKESLQRCFAQGLQFSLVSKLGQLFIFVEDDVAISHLAAAGVLSFSGTSTHVVEKDPSIVGIRLVGVAEVTDAEVIDIGAAEFQGPIIFAPLTFVKGWFPRPLRRLNFLTICEEKVAEENER